MSKQKVVLSIALLASNRKDTITKCLDSLEPIREQIPSELIILDTGCDEDLHLLLEERADIVENFTWCSDFSKARNECLKYAGGEWFLYLDDDEWFVDTEELIDFFRSGDYRDYGSASYIQRNFLDMEATQYTDTWVARMIRLEEDTHFESKIHEYLTPTRGEHKKLRSMVYHFGYVYPDEAAKLAHFERNRVLLEEMIREEPQKIRWKLQLVQEYRAIDDFSHMKELGQVGLDQLQDSDDYADHVYRGTFYAAIILGYLGEQQYRKAKEVCIRAEADERSTKICLAFLSLSRARCCFYLGEYAEAEAYAKRYLAYRTWFDEHTQELYSQQVAPFVGECFDVVKIKEGYSLLICAGLKQGNAAYLEQHLDQLKWNEHHLYVFEEMVPTLIEAMCTLPREPIFEETLRVMHGHGPLWEYVCGQIMTYEQAGHSITPVMNMIRDVIPEALASGEQPAAGEENTHAAGADAQEMQELAGQIKVQLRMLIENGMVEQARSIIGQIRSMLPEDEELMELERNL